MTKFNKGDLVRFNCDIRLGRLDRDYEVLAVSDVYGMVRLRDRKSCICISWYPASDVSKVSFYQPILIRQGV